MTKNVLTRTFGVFPDPPSIAWEAIAAENGLPAGGTADQVLAKVSGTDYDADWVDPSAPGPDVTDGSTTVTAPPVIEFAGATVTNDGGNALVTITGGGGGGGGGPVQYDYVTRTSNITITATTSATAQAVLTGNAVTYDGVTRVLLEYFVPIVDHPNQAYAVLYDGSTELGLLEIFNSSAQGHDFGYASILLTPSAGSHTYSVRFYKGGSDPTIYCGNNTAGSYAPGYLRITGADAGAGGGLPGMLSDEIATDESTSSTSYANLATDGPKVTIATTGDYLVILSCRAYLGAAGRVFVGPAVGNTNPTWFHETSPGDGESISMTIKMSLTAGDVLKFRYKVSTGTAFFSYRSLKVIPIGSANTEKDALLQGMGFGGGVCIPHLLTTGSNLNSQVLNGTLVGLTAGETITNLYTWVKTAGTSTPPTGIYLAIYDTSGNRLAITGNLNGSSEWTATGYATAALTSPFVVPTTGAYYIVLVQDGNWAGTNMVLGVFPTSQAGAAKLGSGPSFGVTQSGQASPPSTATFSTSTFAIWYAWS